MTLKLLRSTKTHPTAGWLYDKLKNEFPHLSLGTVYRNLKILREQGHVKKIEMGAGFDRFEANIKPHYHFICENCEKIFDVDKEPSKEINRIINDHTAHRANSHRIEFFGLCESCK